MKYKNAETGSKLVLIDRDDYERCVNLGGLKESISYIVKTDEDPERYRAYDSLHREVGSCWGCLDNVNVGYYDLTNTIKGEEKMSEEQTKRPEYVIIVKNTEVFKKGGVFKYYASFYAPVNTEEAYTVKPYGDEYIRHEQVDVLLEKKIAVEAVQFNPAFVTLEQNEALQNTLNSMNKKPAKKKAATKKSK